MRSLCLFLCLSVLPLAAQEKIAIVGLVHSHVWGHLGNILKGSSARLVGVAETNPDLIAEAKKMGVAGSLFHPDAAKMLDEQKPAIVWAFVPNNRHLEIVRLCGPRKINVIFEKPLASTYHDALEIRALARRYGIRVMTNYQMAWWPSNYQAKAEADSGALGRVWRIRGIVGHGGPSAVGVRNKYFFDWLTDPEQNGAGALMDFECYNALWSLWYFGRPLSVYAEVNQLRPQLFPKVEDNSSMVLRYKDAVGLFEGSWDLPRSFQDLEVFGLGGSLYVTREKLELRKGKGEPESVPLHPLAADRADPVSYMVSCIRSHQPVQGLTSLDMNVGVVEIIEAAKLSVRTGRAVELPLPPDTRAPDILITR